jgi:hypothetical protein
MLSLLDGMTLGRRGDVGCEDPGGREHSWPSDTGMQGITRRPRAPGDAPEHTVDRDGAHGRARTADRGTHRTGVRECRGTSSGLADAGSTGFRSGSYRLRAARSVRSQQRIRRVHVWPGDSVKVGSPRAVRLRRTPKSGAAIGSWMLGERPIVGESLWHGRLRPALRRRPSGRRACRPATDGCGRAPRGGYPCGAEMRKSWVGKHRPCLTAL